MCSQSDQKHAGQRPSSRVGEADRHHGPTGPDEEGRSPLPGLLPVPENAGHHPSTYHQQSRVIGQRASKLSKRDVFNCPSFDKICCIKTSFSTL